MARVFTKEQVEKIAYLIVAEGAEAKHSHNTQNVVDLLNAGGPLKTNGSKWKSGDVSFFKRTHAKAITKAAKAQRTGEIPAPILEERTRIDAVKVRDNPKAKGTGGLSRDTIAAILTDPLLNDNQRLRYAASLYSDENAVQAPCTAKATSYCALTIAGLIVGQVKSYIEEQKTIKMMNIDAASGASVVYHQ